MELRLTRLREPRYTFTDRTIGRLFINDSKTKYCNTLEDVERFPTVWKDLQELVGIKVYGKTAIPTGRYEIAVTYSAKFKRMMILIMNVPQYTGVRLHSGTTPEDTEGCPLLGRFNPKNNTVYGGKSLKIEETLLKIVLEALKTEKVFITIE